MFFFLLLSLSRAPPPPTPQPQYIFIYAFFFTLTTITLTQLPATNPLTWPKNCLSHRDRDFPPKMSPSSNPSSSQISLEELMLAMSLGPDWLWSWGIPVGYSAPPMRGSWQFWEFYSPDRGNGCTQLQPVLHNSLGMTVMWWSPRPR